MKRHYLLPVNWLFTDPRMGDALWSAIARLPKHSGIIFRHYECSDRTALAERVAAAARRAGHLLVIAGDAKLARRLGVATHMPSGRRVPAPLTASAHCRSEIVRARRAGASLVFLSPVYATASHPDRRALGPVRFGLLSRAARIRVGALGGMNPARAKLLRQTGAAAVGAIDMWSGN